MSRAYKRSVFVGDVVENRRGELAILVEYVTSKNCTVEFEDGTRVKTDAHQFRNGRLTNPNARSVHGVGILGVFPSGLSGADFYTETTIWRNMLRRCYVPQLRYPTYIGCSVHEDWHHFQNYRKWFAQSGYQPGWQMDKDIAVKGNKVYGPDTTFCVPPEINGFAIFRGNDRGPYPLGVTWNKNHNKFQAQLSKGGRQTVVGEFTTVGEAASAYKEAKESHARYLAHKYAGQVHQRIYDALLHYTLDADQQFGPLECWDAVQDAQGSDAGLGSDDGRGRFGDVV